MIASTAPETNIHTMAHHIVTDIQFQQIDLDSIDNADENPEAVVFDVVLTGTPSEVWVDEFAHAYRTTLHPIKPIVVVDGGRLRVHFLPRYQSELQSFLDFLSDVVCEATEETRLTESIKTTDEKEQRKIDFRKVLEGVSLPEREGVLARPVSARGVSEE